MTEFARSVETAISLPDEIFRRVEDAAKRLGVSRSEFTDAAAAALASGAADRRLHIARVQD